MFVKIPNVRVSAVRAAVPSREKKIEDELEYYGGSLKKAIRAKNMIGTDRRRLAWAGQTAADLCVAAARDLLKSHPDLADTMDALIFVSQFPDYDLPATACVLQEKLGLTQGCAAFDVNQGCAGYVYGLWLAAGLIHAGCRNILLLAGDVTYRPRDERNRVIAPIFGDGGSATLLQAVDNAPPLIFSIGTDGRGFEHIIVPAGRGRIPVEENADENRAILEDIQAPDGTPWQLVNTYMDGGAVFTFTMDVVPAHIAEFIGQSGLEKDSFAHFILHQANRQIIGEIARRAGLPAEKTPYETFSRYGNLSSASIPAALCDLFGQRGSTGECRLLLSGYGVGLSWASCVWDAENCDIAPVINVGMPEKGTSREAMIDYWRKKIEGIADERE